MDAAGILKCAFCDKSYGIRKSLNRHVRENHPEHADRPAPVKKCPHPGCGFETRVSNKFSEHKKKHNEDKIPCNVCSREFKHARSLEEHKKSAHTREALERCPYFLRDPDADADVPCPGEFPSTTKLKKHIKKVHAIAAAVAGAENACQNCGKVFPDRHKYNEHARLNPGGRCAEVAYKKHIAAVRAVRRGNAAGGATTRISCDFQGCPAKPFESVHALVAHRDEVHGPVNSSTHCCPRAGCGKRFKFRGEFLRHASACLGPAFPPESAAGLFTHPRRATRPEPPPDPCDECGRDRTMGDKHLADWYGHYQMSERFDTECFAYVPIPQHQFADNDTRAAATGAELAIALQSRNMQLQQYPIVWIRKRAPFPAAASATTSSTN